MFRGRRLSSGLLLALGATLISFRVAAQDRLVLRAYRPSTDDFPHMSLNVSLTDSDGERVPGAADGVFSLIEDGEPIENIQVEEISLATRQVFVINTNADLRVRDASGVSRFEQIKNALFEWWRLPDASVLGVDDLSLITPEGVLAQHSTSSAELASALDSFEPLFQDDVDGYALLLETLNLLYDSPLLDSPSFLFFATPILPSNAELPIDNIISQANENGTAVFPIALTSSTDLEQPGIEPLREIAAGTGGQLLILDPAAGLNQLAAQILEFRTVYRIQYQSRIQTEGEHSLQVQAEVGELLALSEPQLFTLNVLPPEVTFIQPPIEIVRESDDSALPLTSYPPTEVNIQVLINFPDGYDRSIVSSALYINEEMVLENAEPPYDRFEWDISDLLEPGAYSLRVAIEDELGLQAETIGHRVQLAVNIPPSGIAALGPALGSLLSVFVLIIVGVASLTIALTWARKRREILPSRNIEASPNVISSRRSNLLNDSLQAPIEANLVRTGEETRPDNWIPLTGAAINLGSDPSLAPYPFSDPSVNGLHANLKRNAAGNYVIRDQGSRSGTWVNYHPVSGDGCIIQHGDRIHIGRVELRFLLNAPPPSRRIQTSELEENLAVHPPTREAS